MKISDAGICLLGIIVSLVMFWKTLHFFSKDDTRIAAKQRAIYGWTLAIAVTNMLLFCVSVHLGIYIAFSFFNVYLMITVYIDLKTLYVYRIVNGVFFLLGIAMLVLLKVPIDQQLAGAFIYIVFVVLEARMGGMGVGDAFTLIAGVPYMMLLNAGGSFLMMMLVHTLLVNIIFLLLNIKNINLKEMKFNEKAAFTPAIALATLIMVLSVGLVNSGL